MQLIRLIRLIATMCACAVVPASSSPYQIVLTQMGFTQFVEYDVMIPPLSEFTYCMWLRTTDMRADQPIFTYVVESNYQVVSVWLEAGGGHLHTRLDQETEKISPVDWSTGVWRHLCFSWQSDAGAWALYQDGKVLTCHASENLVGYIVPSGGRILLGYGPTDSAGYHSGWEGDIYEFNMILSSTIERNHTRHFAIQEANFKSSIQKNKNKQNDVFRYVIIGDLDADHTHEDKINDDTYTMNDRPSQHKSKNHITVNTQHSHVNHDVGNKFIFPIITNNKSVINSLHDYPIKYGMEESNEPEVLDIVPPKITSPNTFWGIINKAGQEGKFKLNTPLTQEQNSTETKELPIPSQFEMPPPKKNIEYEILMRQPNNEPTHIKIPVGETTHIFLKPVEHPLNIQQTSDILEMVENPFIQEPLPTLSLMETPPRPQSDNKVYGHWSISTYPGAVLDFLNMKNISSKSAPRTIPLKKISDSFPYSSERITLKVNPTLSTFRHKHVLPYPYSAMRRQSRSPEINVKIIHDNIREYILQQHATEQAQNVQVTPRGDDNNSQDYSTDEIEAELRIPRAYTRPFQLRNHKMNNRSMNTSKSANKITTQKYDSQEYFDTSNGYKWHNIQSFNNDFTAKHWYHNGTNIKDSIFSDNQNLQSLPQPVHLNPWEAEARELLKNRAIAIEVSKMSDLPYGLVTSPQTRTRIMQLKPRIKSFENMTFFQRKKKHENPFYKSVKLGNALNEQYIIGKGEEDKRRSFIGGDDKIPDIHRHRSDIDGDGKGGLTKAPPSLTAKVCEQTWSSSAHTLFIQVDGSIDMSNIFSTAKKTNPALRLVQESQVKCTDRNKVTIQRHPLMLIEWKKTPVRLFGGARLKRTTGLCDII